VKSMLCPVRLARVVLVLLILTVPARVGSAQEAALQGLALSTGNLVPAFDPRVTDYTITALGSLFPIEVTALADPKLHLTINSHDAAAGAPFSLTLRPREDVVVSVESSAGEKRTYTVHYLPPSLPSYTVAKLNPALMGSEKIFLTPWPDTDNGWLLVVNRDGDPLYYRSIAPTFATDFKQHQLPGGKVVYSFAVSNEKVHLLDDHFREIGEVALLPNRDHGALPVDLHDFILLDDDHYVVLAQYEKTVDLSPLNTAWASAVRVVANIVQEVDHGKVVFEWESTDVPSLFTDSVDGNAFTSTSDPASDYVHVNSIQVDPADGNFIISLRHTNSVLKLDRSTGATIWTLGGISDQFGLTAEQRFSHQHHARKLDDGRLLIFDNGNNAHPTRVVSFLLDETQKSVSSFQVICQRPAEQADTTFMGSAARLGEARYLIGWGGRSDTTSAGPAVTEIVAGVPVWSLTFAGPTVFSYRALPEGTR
jgi:Arylsulfotransferase (ASST)/Cadherin-like beta sandwich domain